MKHKWKCEECVKHGTDACYNGGRYDHDDCKYMLIDVDYAYNKGRADRDKEIAEHNVFFSNKPIEDIVLDAITDERAKCETCIHKVTKADIDAIENTARTDERAKVLEILKKEMLFGMCDGNEAIEEIDKITIKEQE